MIDPIDGTGESTRALNVIAAVRRQPASTAAEIVDYLNDVLMPDMGTTDDVGPFSLDYVNSGITKAGALLTESAGEYSLTNADRYVQRDGDNNIELAPVGAAFRRGYMW